MTTSEPRDHMVNYLERQLIGAGVEGSDEFPEVEYPPYRHYLMGVLWPRDSSMDGDMEEVEENEDGSGHEDEHAAAVASAYEYNPSSLGLSFFVRGKSPRVAVEIDASIYDGDPDDVNGNGSVPWRREKISNIGHSPAHEIDPAGDTPERLVLDGRAKLTTRARRYGDGWVITVAMVNLRESHRIKARTRDLFFYVDPSDFLFQVRLRCSAINGSIDVYPGDRASTWDEEEDELRLLYRDRQIFAAGHGVSVDWDEESSRPEWVRTEHLPRGRVPDVTFDVALTDPSVLKWQVLAAKDSKRNVTCDALASFVTDYRDWIEKQEIPAEAESDEHLATAAGRISSRLQRAAARMSEGVEMLRSNPDWFRAFILANEAILMQRIHLRKQHAGETHALGTAIAPPIDYFDPSLATSTDPLAWRPFQLAFILLVIPSLVDASREDRELVDLLWFPTGGGKTEAYLGLTAFEIFRRRIVDGPTGCGTAVIKRYTYRVLTFQQFERASSLIAACELIRRRESLEDAEVAIGLWVGGEITPNSHAVAEEAMKLLDRGRNPFQIRRCPWCGTSLESTDPAARGFEASPTHFRVFCPDERCAFHNGIPALIVDTDLYDRPPSLVIATIDKFAQLPWNERSGDLLGRTAPAVRNDPPSIFIQDELHLINGPLGTIAGLYEAAIDVICERRGSRPKIIGATATIRRAASQCRALYGREPAVFPPPGMQIDDSFFMRLDHSRPGRLYVGVMGQGHRPLSSFIHVSAAMALGAAHEDLNAHPVERDGYWTQIVYHNSRRELGKTMTAARDDIPKRMTVVENKDGGPSREFRPDRVLQLAGTTKSEEIPDILEALDQQWSDSGPDDAVDLLASTSILSVGVDKPRLGLMLMNGQPKTTSEYIQATSRIGRGLTPGLVVVALSYTKPRDRSHYETFKGYHESVYRFVEPVSVTPYALPARERALPAAFIAAIRHGYPLPKEDQARLEPLHLTTVRQIRNLFLERCMAADSGEAADLDAHLEKIIERWHDLSTGRALRYSNRGQDRARRYLIRPMNTPTDRGEWTALNSMRLVDVECLLNIKSTGRGGTT